MNLSQIKKLPKTDLHCHLDGSVRTKTILDLARRQNYSLPASNVNDLRKYVRVPAGCRSLSQFLQRFEIFYPLLKTPYALKRITYELLRDCSLENTKYLEIRFAPVLQQKEGFPLPSVIESVLEGVDKARAEFKIKAGVILCLYRGTSEKDIMETARSAVEFKDRGVCGVDIAGDETCFGLKEFKKPIKLCREKGLKVTIHAGEAGGPENIKEAISMGADRIGHGTSLCRDPKLIDRVAKEQIPLEVCITSNVQTQVVSGYDAHPFKEFFKRGVKITLNTDDRGVSGIDLSYEYDKALKLGLGVTELKEIILNGLEYSFQGLKEKNEMRKEFIAELNERTG